MKNVYASACTAVALVALLVGASAPAAMAQIKVGVTISQTGPAATLGLTERDTITLLPREIADQKVDYIVLDDYTDPAKAVKNTRLLISDHHVDVVIGSSVTPSSLAMVDVAAEGQTPNISLASSARIVEPATGPRHWIFKTTESDSLMASAIVDAMVKQHVKTLGFIGFSDTYGQSYLDEMTAAANRVGIRITDVERYARGDTSVIGQVLKLVAANPDAILIVGAGTPSALPARELKSRNYRGIVWQSHGAGSDDVLRVCGKDCEGSFLPAAPLLVARQLPADNQVRPEALRYIAAYEPKFGPVSTFGGTAWDAGQLLVHAIPVALATGAKPGTAEFRGALRTALENLHDVVGSQGVFNMSPQDHNGMDTRARVIVEIVNGKWKYRPDL